jgi:hypothetical protein
VGLHVLHKVKKYLSDKEQYMYRNRNVPSEIILPHYVVVKKVVVS